MVRGWDDGGGINCRSENRGGELRDHVSVSMDGFRLVRLVFVSEMRMRCG